jgi:hypothetical protein
MRAATQPMALPGPAFTPRPGPVDDLIRRHRLEMREIWNRHVRELQDLKLVRAA